MKYTLVLFSVVVNIERSQYFNKPTKKTRQNVFLVGAILYSAIIHFIVKYQKDHIGKFALFGSQNKINKKFNDTYACPFAKTLFHSEKEISLLVTMA